MILRRLSRSLRDQNWTAIVIEFLLLVAGVFLGIQVANWNQARVDRAEYEAALVRLGAEIDTNLAKLDEFDPEIARALGVGGRALTTLQSCVDSPGNRRIIEDGLQEIRGTAGLHPHRGALDDLTSNPRLLSQQADGERRRFSELRFYFDVLQRNADFSERQPEASAMADNPILRVGAPGARSASYFGFEWLATQRKLELAVPMEEACRDNQLIKSFFDWERRQASLPVIARKWRAELVATKALLEARRPAPR